MRERRDADDLGPPDSLAGPDAPDRGPFPRFLALAGPDDPGAAGDPAGRARRRLASRAWLASGAVLLLVAATYLVGLAIRALEQAEPYQLDFDGIELDPEPPAYIKIGRAGLLRQVRERAQAPPRFSTLGLDPATLARWFGLHSPWVERVEGIHRTYPNRLVVRLKYREPVALVDDHRPPLFLDRSAVVLPNLEIDTGAARPLVRIVGLPGPLTAREGVGVAPGGDEQAERRARDACALAGFLKDRRRQAGPVPEAAEVAFLYAEATPWLRTASGLYVSWGDPPGREPEGSPTAAEKYAQLLAWCARPGPHGAWDFLEFTRDGPRLRKGRPRHGPEPRDRSPASGGSARSPSR